MPVGKKAVFLSLVFVFLCRNSVSADEGSLEYTVRQLQMRMEVLEKKVLEQDSYIKSQTEIIQTQQEKISRYEDRFSEFDDKLHRQNPAETMIGLGLEIGAGATLIVQGANNVNAGDNTLKDSRTDSSYTADITLEKEFGETGGRAFLHVEAGEGSGLEDDLVLYSSVNRDAGDSDNGVEVTEVWYEQTILNEEAAVTFGKLDPTAYFDNNEAANDETTQFLGRIFRNSPAVEFPDNTAGIRLAYMPFEWLELGYGIFDGNGDWEKVSDNLFNIGQVTLKTVILGRSGNYRFYGKKKLTASV